MTLKMRCGLTALRLLAVCELTVSSMVLPRPPSTPNEIPRETIRGENEKFRNEKGHNSLHQNTNVEKPNTDGYRLLEIELGFAEDGEERNLRGLVEAMLGKEDVVHRRNSKWYDNEDERYPKPEVIPNSILGVREIPLPSNYRTSRLSNDPEDDKRTLVRPPSILENEEKLYYLKNNRPKVDVEPRGNSGNYRKNKIISATINEEISIIGQTADRQSPLLNKKNRRSKKYQRGTSRTKQLLDSDNSSSEGIYGTGEYEPRPDRANDESTTENTSVTSSELPKQIPAPPSHFPSFFIVAQTTPVQKYSLRRTDVIPGYTYAEV